jgi:hypothetical protein
MGGLPPYCRKTNGLLSSRSFPDEVTTKAMSEKTILGVSPPLFCSRRVVIREGVGTTQEMSKD